MKDALPECTTAASVNSTAEEKLSGDSENQGKELVKIIQRPEIKINGQITGNHDENEVDAQINVKSLTC